MNLNLRYHILKLLAILPLLLTMAPAMAQNGSVVYPGETTVLSVEEVPGVTYTWELYNDVEGINLVEVPGNIEAGEAEFVDGINTGATVEVRWLQPGTYFFKVTATDDCTDNLKLGRIEVEEDLPVAYFLEPDTICIGDPGFLDIEWTGTPPLSVEYTIQFLDEEGESGEIETFTINDINSQPHWLEVDPDQLNQIGNYVFTITSVTDANGVTNNEPSESVTLTVEPRPITSPIERYNPISEVE